MSGRENSSNGVIFVATGSDYLDLALDAANSVASSNPALPIDLFTDLPEQVPEALFTAIHRIDEPHSRSKIDCLPLSRFERTLFLDCDTRVVRDLGDFFGLLDRFDLALAHDVRRASPLIREGWKIETPYAFPQLNSGVLLYASNDRTMTFFRQWARDFQASGLDRDQPTLRDLLWKSDLRFHVLPPEFNLRRMTMLDAWEPLDALPTIFHSHIFLQHLRVPGASKVSDMAAVIEIERENWRREWAEVDLNDYPFPPRLR
jgi:Nucleotide-diphospho-sugar transferase